MRGISSGTGDRPDHRQPAVAAADPPPSLRRGQRLATQTQWHRPRLRKHPDHPQHHPGRPRRPPGRPHPAVRGLPDQPGRPDRDHPPKRPIRPRLTAPDNQLVSVAKASDPRRPRTAGQGRTAHRLDITSRVRDANKGGEHETSIPRHCGADGSAGSSASAGRAELRGRLSCAGGERRASRNGGAPARRRPQRREYGGRSDRWHVRSHSAITARPGVTGPGPRRWRVTGTALPGRAGRAVGGLAHRAVTFELRTRSGTDRHDSCRLPVVLRRQPGRCLRPDHFHAVRPQAWVIFSISAATQRVSKDPRPAPGTTQWLNPTLRGRLRLVAHGRRIGSKLSNRTESEHRDGHTDRPRPYGRHVRQLTEKASRT